MASQKSEKIYRLIRDDVEALLPNTRLMSIRVMMRKYEASQLLVDRALARLVDDELIRRRDDGYYVEHANSSEGTSVGLVLIDWPSMVFAEFAEQLQRKAAQHNIRIVRLAYPPFQSFRHVRIPGGLKALLILPAAALSIDDVLFLNNLPVPSLILQHIFYEFQLNFIGPDPYKGGMLAAAYLLRRGHRKMGLLYSQLPSNTIIQQRARGFIDTVRMFGAKVEILDLKMRKGDAASDRAFPFLTNYLEECRPDFTALYTLCDTSAKTAICVLTKAGYRVPEDISVIGGEGLNDSALFVPALTTVGVDTDKYMETIVNSVEQLIEDPSTQVQKIIPPQIIERNSVASIANEKVKI